MWILNYVVFARNFTFSVWLLCHCKLACEHCEQQFWLFSVQLLVCMVDFVMSFEKIEKSYGAELRRRNGILNEALLFRTKTKTFFILRCYTRQQQQQQIIIMKSFIVHDSLPISSIFHPDHFFSVFFHYYFLEWPTQSQTQW